MDVLPSVGILYELQAIHDTGYLLCQASAEDYWHQVSFINIHSLRSQPNYLPSVV